MPSTSPRVLIADDQRDVLEALRLLLKGQGYQIDTVESPAAALTALSQRDYDVVLIDLNYARDTTSGEEGLELLRQIHAGDAMLPVIVMTPRNLPNPPQPFQPQFFGLNRWARWS